MRSADMLKALAQSFGKDKDPVVRQRIAHLYWLQEVARFNAMRSRAAAQAGQRTGPEGSLHHSSSIAGRHGRGAAEHHR